MNKHNVATFFSKAFGVYVIIGALWNLISIYSNFALWAPLQLAEPKQEQIRVLIQSGPAVLWLLFGILLIVKADFFASRMINDEGAPIQGIDNRDLRIFVYRFVGLSLMISAIIESIRNLLNYFNNVIPFVLLLNLLQSIVELIIGVLLFFGFRSTINFIKRIRTAGLENN